jgi:hypothetical protein
MGTNAANLGLRRPELSSKNLGKVAAADVIRIDRNPMSGDILYMNRGGKFWKVDVGGGAATAAETNYPGTGDHRGMAFGPDGTLYTLSVTGNPISATIRKGVANGATRTWTTMATTASYPVGGTNFDHSFAGVVVSPDNQSLYFASGSRTDHGEPEANQREVPLTSAVFRIPVSANNLNIPNTDQGSQPYLFADGTRNTFDMAFNADGDLFGADNGPDIDLPDELNVLRQGKHYGFPWRFGAEANPVLDAAYVAMGDTRLHVGFQAVDQGKYVYDAQFPPAPAGVTFVDPIPNHGPDQDKQRVNRTAAVTKASATGGTLAGVTGHRSPLGLTFDTKGTLCGDYNKAGFMLSFGALIDVMQDGGQDLALINLTKAGENYEMKVTTLVTGFLAPIDTTMVDNKIYVVELGANGRVIEITLPVPR